MSDLRTLHRSLAARAVVVTPPFDDVVGNARRVRARQAKSAVVVLAVIAVLAGLSLAPPQQTAHVVDNPQPRTSAVESSEGGSESSDPPAGGSGTATTATTPPSATASNEPTSPPTHYECSRGKNGGATGEGVTPNRIRLLASTHRSGPYSSFSEGVFKAWAVLVNKVNAGGGICGRLVDLRMVDQAFDKQVYAEGTVGMLVTPIDADFTARIADGSVDRAGVPVVVADGFRRVDYISAWARPLGPPVATYARIIADDAYRAGARTFGVVHDPETTAGEELVAALRDYLGRLPGATLKVVQPLDPRQASYADEAESYNRSCGDSCDAVVLSVLPDTASKWLSRQPSMGRIRTSALPFLLSERFSRECGSLLGSACENLWVWSGFTPPIADFLGDPDVAHYAGQVDDPLNPFTLSAYVAGQVLLEALKAVGPNLNRERLRRALDDMTYRSGLVSQLDWRPDAVGNPFARAVRPGESGFVDAGTGWRRDPMPGHFPD